MVSIVNLHAALAGTAAQQAAEKVPRSFDPAWRFMAACLLPLLHRLEQILIDNPQMLRVRPKPLTFGVGARDTLAGVGILHHANAIPHQRSSVNLVRENAVPARLVAVDRAGVPGWPARWRNPLFVQALGNVPRRPAIAVFGEYPPDDLGLALNNLHLAGLAQDRPVSVGPAAGMSSVSNDARLAAPYLVGEVGEEQCADKPTHADLNGVGRAVVNCPELDSEELQPLPYAGEVFLVARYAIESFHHDDIEVTGARVAQKLLQPVASKNGCT